MRLISWTHPRGSKTETSSMVLADNIFSKTIGIWTIGMHFLKLSDYRNIEYWAGKLGKLSDYRILDTKLKLSEYRISDI